MRPADARPLSTGDDSWIDSELTALTLEIRDLVGDLATVRPPAQTLAEPPRLRVARPPDLPYDPFPLLLPYTHPELFAGRQRELDEVRRRLRRLQPILGVYAPSGAGKSSLLAAGLIPALRAEGLPVALVRHLDEPRLAARLVNALLAVDERTLPQEEGDPTVFVDHIETARRLAAGTPPLLVLDQFEDVLRPELRRARAEVRILIAATVRQREGLEEPLCRWLLAYRQEFHGDVCAWLADVLADTPEGGERIGLFGVDRFHTWVLPLFGTPPQGKDRLEKAAAVFKAAITAPLALTHAAGTQRYPWSFADDGAARLARAFAEARLEQHDAPLLPELQVVLEHLHNTARAAAAGMFEIVVPEDPRPLIDAALETHLEEVLGSAPQGRSRALRALHELAMRPVEGMGARELAAAIGPGGDEILDHLAGGRARLIVARENPDDPADRRYVLSHGRIAEVVQRVVEESVKLDADRELLRLRRIVALKTERYRAKERRQSTTLTRVQYRQIEKNAVALLWGKERKDWWEACQQRRRGMRRRWMVGSTVVVAALILFGSGIWTWVGRKIQTEVLLTEVSTGHPSPALDAVLRLVDCGIAAERIGARLRKREQGGLLKLFEIEVGPQEVHPVRWTEVRLAAVRIGLPLLDDAEPQDLALFGVLAWVLDDVAARDPPFAAEARYLREAVLTPLRRWRPPPESPHVPSPEWAAIPAGSFTMGSPEGVGRDEERPAHEVRISPFLMLVHEVTVAEYRRLVPDFPGEPEHPVVNVNWYEAYAYAAWLGGRLPTEAEWEYAARAACQYSYCDRNGNEARLEEVGWTGERLEGSIYPIAQLEPNPWGLYDMYGNAWEWVADWNGPYSVDPLIDPWGPPTGSARIIRGGGNRSTPDRTRAAFRDGWRPWEGDRDQGFRVALPISLPMDR